MDNERSRSDEWIVEGEGDEGTMALEKQVVWKALSGWDSIWQMQRGVASCLAECDRIAQMKCGAVRSGDS